MRKYLHSKNAIKDGRKTQAARVRKSAYKFEQRYVAMKAWIDGLTATFIETLKTMARDIATLSEQKELLP